MTKRVTHRWMHWIAPGAITPLPTDMLFDNAMNDWVGHSGPACFVINLLHGGFWTTQQIKGTCKVNYKVQQRLAYIRT